MLILIPIKNSMIFAIHSFIDYFVQYLSFINKFFKYKWPPNKDNDNKTNSNHQHEGTSVVNLFSHNRGVEEKIPINGSHPETHLRDHLNYSKQDGKRPSWKTKLIKMIMEDIVLIIMTSL